MIRKRLSPLVLVPVLAFALAGTAAQVAASPPAATAVAPAPAPAAGPPVLPWGPALCEMKSEEPLLLPTPAACPPICPACKPPSRCTLPCQVHFGCTICTCVR
jgi:hypothetical protein